MGLGLKAQFSVGVRQGYGAYGAYLETSGSILNKYQIPHMLSNTGLVIIYNGINNSGLQMEINYAPKGWQEEDTSVVGSYYKKTINYIEVPIYSRWEVDLGKIRPIIFGGPYLAWKLSESTDSANFSHLWNDANPYQQYDQDIKDVGFGIKFGLGIKYNISSRFAIYIDGRYDFQVFGSRDIFIDRPNGIQASRLTEISGTFGIVWNIIPQRKHEEKNIYRPKEDLYD